MELTELVKLTEKRVQNIKASELAELFPVLTELEREMLSVAIRNEGKLETTDYYHDIGVTIEMIIYRLTEQKTLKEVTHE